MKHTYKKNKRIKSRQLDNEDEDEDNTQSKSRTPTPSKSRPISNSSEYKTELCNKKMTFQECEIAILRHAVDETEKRQGQKMAKSDDIQKILKIVEDFIVRKKLVCYGGTAINNILPKYAQFYNRDIEIPDYDFFSPNALDDAKELADIYYKSGYVEVEAKAGMHMGTFKVFVNFIPIADITYMHKDLYAAIFKDSIVVLNTHYAPPNYLRMAMYLELSRPAGDVSRWEKVMKRLNLLNTHYPLVSKDKCYKLDFSKQIEDAADDLEQLYITIRDSLIDQSTVFFGGYAMSLYSKYANNTGRSVMANRMKFDVLSEEPEKCATIIKENLTRANFKNIKTVKHPAFSEIIPEHIEIIVGKRTMAFIYKPIACHSYNQITIDGKQIHVATIDTILTFYLSFLYADMPYYNRDRLMCMANFLFEIEQQNRLEQRGLLKRFSIDCYGKQPTMEDIRAEKANKFKELKNDRNSEEYEMWFLKYVPDKKKNKTPEPTEVLEKESHKERDVEMNKDESKESSIFSSLFGSSLKKNNKTKKRRATSSKYLV